jgi:hypothetical protein
METKVDGDDLWAMGENVEQWNDSIVNRAKIFKKNLMRW